MEEKIITGHKNGMLVLLLELVGPVKIYAQNYLQARLSEVNRQ